MTNKAFRLCFFNSESVNSLHVKKHSRRTLLDHGYPFIDPINKWLDNWDSGKLPMFYCKEIGMEMVSNFAESWYWNDNCLLSGWLVNTSMLQSLLQDRSPPPPTLKETVSLNGFYTQCLKYLLSNILVYKSRYVGLSSGLFIWETWNKKTIVSGFELSWHTLITLN